MKSEFKQLFEEYKQLEIGQSKEEFDQIKIEFVYHSTKLEGSDLTLIQTKDVIENHHIKGEASLIDSLMAVDHYRALNLALSFGSNKYPLTEKILLNLHETLLKNTFEIDPFYQSWKNEGQQLGQLKIKSNRIKYTLNNNESYYETPSPEISRNILRSALNNYDPKSGFIDSLSKLVQNIYNAHPFFDGNKRMTRLIVANQSIANGLPLIPIPFNKGKYNKALITGFIEQTHLPLKKEIEIIFNQFLAESIEKLKNNSKKPNKGFGLIL